MIIQKIEKTVDIHSAEIIDALIKIEHDAEGLERQGIPADEIRSVIDALSLKLEVKITGAASIITQYDAMIERAKTAKKQIDTLISVYENRREGLHDYIAWACANGGIREIAADTIKVGYSVTENNRTVIDDESLIPRKYMTEKVTYTPDKTSIKKAIQSGEHVDGAHLENTERISIKGI